MPSRVCRGLANGRPRAFPLQTVPYIFDTTDSDSADFCTFVEALLATED